VNSIRGKLSRSADERRVAEFNCLMLLKKVKESTRKMMMMKKKKM
jgi:hypothetical protein